jgi:5-methylcytosine-specific restriction endonuclease McrA
MAERYFTGKPCVRGHISERFRSTRTCCACNSERNSTPSLVQFRKVYYANRYRSNPEHALAIGRAYNATEIGRASTIVRAARRRAKKKAAPGSFTANDLNRIRAAQRDRCAYCKKPLRKRGSLDHIKPLDSGGTNWPRNLQWLCRPCNSQKHTKDALDFAREIGNLL